MLKKGNIVKSTILLIILVILAISVCFSEVYAWFYEASTANAIISGDVGSFYFTTNGKFEGNIELTPGAPGTEAGEHYFTYENGAIPYMYPGQTAKVKLILSNENSNVPVNFKIRIKSSGNHLPKDCILTVIDEGKEYVHLISELEKTGEIIYPPATQDALAGSERVKKLAAGATQEVLVYITWPKSEPGKGILASNDYYPYKDNTGNYDDNAKNAGDIQFMRESCLKKDENGSWIVQDETPRKQFKVIFEITAEQATE